MIRPQPLLDVAEGRSRFHVHSGDCLELLAEMSAAGVFAHSFVCDPPAGISFMGRHWDSDMGGRAQWVAYWADRFRAAREVCLPGAHGLVWALPRTQHWTACALEEAGWEIVDVINHLFSQGRPAGLDVSKGIDKALGAARTVLGPNPNGTGRTRNILGGRLVGGMDDDRGARDMLTKPASPEAEVWSGFHTRIKPACEFWILVRNPLDGTTVENVLRHGVGALNIDACRVPRDWTERGESWARSGHSAKPEAEKIGGHPPGNGIPCNPSGGYPANVVITHHPGCEPGEPCHEDCWVRRIDEQGGERASGAAKVVYPTTHRNVYNNRGIKGGRPRPASTGGASRFFNCFYHPKASRSDRNSGLYDDSENDHETVKAIGLMEHFISLVTPTSKQVPGGGIVLDITAGSGPTGVAAMNKGMRFLGAELRPDKAELAQKRIAGTLFGGPLALGASP